MDAILPLGPCVARSPAAARELLRWIVARHPGETLYWDLLPANREAVRIATDLGFASVRRLTRMALAGPVAGAALPHEDALVYATAGFEYG